MNKDYFEERMPLFVLMIDRYLMKIGKSSATLLFDMPIHRVTPFVQEKLEELFSCVETKDRSARPMEEYDYMITFDGRDLLKEQSPFKEKGIILSRNHQIADLTQHLAKFEDKPQLVQLEKSSLYRIFTSGYAQAQAFVDYYMDHVGMLIAEKRIVVAGNDSLVVPLVQTFFAFNANPCVYKEKSVERLECIINGIQTAQEKDINQADFLFLCKGIEQSEMKFLIESVKEDCCILNMADTETESFLQKKQTEKKINCFMNGICLDRIIFERMPLESVDMMYSLMVLYLETMEQGVQVVTEELCEQLASLRLHTLGVK